MGFLTLKYKEYGDKNAPLILFLHGGGVSSWMWDRQVYYFTDYHCVTIDLPEHGENRDNTLFSIADSAYQIIELLEKLSHGKSITVVGFSLGAQVLIQMLRDKPNFIDNAMINSALVRPIPGKNCISPLIKLSFPFIKNKTLSKLQAKSLYIWDEDLEKYYHETCQMERNTLIRIINENMSFEIPEGFDKAKGKILVTVGTKERNIMKKSARDILHNNKNSTGIAISGVGHGVPLAEPDFFNQILEKWLKNEDLPAECIVIK